MTTIILISGKQGSGKSTLAAGLHRELGCAKVKFADPLYAMQGVLRQVAHKWGIPFAEKEGRLLQLLGTEWGRETKGQDVWVNAAKHAVLKDYVGEVVVIDDCRFENELRAFDGLPKVVTWKVRLKATEAIRANRADGWREDTAHASEIGLDHLPDSAFHQVFDTTTSPPTEVLESVLYHLKYDEVMS